ncbi:MAG: cytochrome c [Cystobacter sp.]
MKLRYALLLLSLSATAAQAQEEDTVAEIWTAKCKSCHGPDGKAQTQMGKKESIRDISIPEWQKSKSDGDIRQVISEGDPNNKKMKAYKDKLTPQQIDALVAYVRGFNKG